MIIVHPETNEKFTRIKTYKVQCDHCKEECGKTSPDPGDAAELARGVGWTTKVGELGDPLKWACPKCKGSNKPVVGFKKS